MTMATRKTKIKKMRRSAAPKRRSSTTTRRSNPVTRRAPVRRTRAATTKRAARRRNPGLLKPAQMKIVRVGAGIVVGAAAGRIVDTMLPRYVAAIPNSVIGALVTTMILGGLVPAKYRADLFSAGVGMIAPAAIDKVYTLTAPAVAGVLPKGGAVAEIKRLSNPAPAYRARPLRANGAARRVLGLPAVNNL